MNFCFQKSLLSPWNNRKQDFRSWTKRKQGFSYSPRILEFPIFKIQKTVKGLNLVHQILSKYFICFVTQSLQLFYVPDFFFNCTNKQYFNIVFIFLVFVDYEDILQSRLCFLERVSSTWKWQHSRWPSSSAGRTGERTRYPSRISGTLCQCCGSIADLGSRIKKIPVPRIWIRIRIKEFK
jgi:hypothetical protein